MAMLALLVDPILEFCCGPFQQALKFQKRKRILWKAMRRNVDLMRFADGLTFMNALNRPIEARLMTDLEDP